MQLKTLPFLLPVILFSSCEKDDNSAIDPSSLDKWVSYSSGTGLADNQVWDIKVDKDGNVWFATGNGVSRFNGNAWKTFRTSDGLINNIVLSVEQDVFGDMYFGTASGFSIYDGSEFSSFTGTGSNLWEVNTMLQASTGSFWFGTNGYGAYELTSNGITEYTFENPDLNYVYDIVEDQNQNIWVATPAGVIRGSDEGLELFTTGSGLAANSVRSLLADSWGHIWMGTFDAPNLNRYINGKIEDISLNQGYETNHIMSMLEDSRGNVWLGTLASGVVKYDGAMMRTYLTDDGLASNRILSLAEDSKGNIWIGTYDNGVTKYLPGLDP